MRAHGVQCLLMGGQACVFYGAAEFSRDIDLALLANQENLTRLQFALDDLQAQVIAIPPFQENLLSRGHAVHFRCQREGVEGFRIDVMARMRGVDPFPTLWERRTTIEVDGIELDLLSLPDLVQAKKTQRSKDWPMIQRLVEAHWFSHRNEPTPARISFWLRECRTPEILMELASTHSMEASAMRPARPVLGAVLENNPDAIEPQLEAERRLEAEADKTYWLPLRKELEEMRIQKNQSP